MVKNPELYSDGPNRLLFNNCILGQWVIYAMIQSFTVFKVLTQIIGKSPEIYSLVKSESSIA